MSPFVWYPQNVRILEIENRLWLPGFRDGGGQGNGCDYKEVARGRASWWCSSSVFWLWWWLNQYSGMMNCHGTIHAHCTHVNFLLLVWYYSYGRCNCWGKLGEGYMSSLYYLSTSSESIFKIRSLKKNLNTKFHSLYAKTFFSVISFL